jgi:hypothetical protein
VKLFAESHRWTQTMKSSLQGDLHSHGRAFRCSQMLTLDEVRMEHYNSVRDDRCQDTEFPSKGTSLPVMRLTISRDISDWVQSEGRRPPGIIDGDLAENTKAYQKDTSNSMNIYDFTTSTAAGSEVAIVSGQAKGSMSDSIDIRDFKADRSTRQLSLGQRR